MNSEDLIFLWLSSHNRFHIHIQSVLDDLIKQGAACLTFHQILWRMSGMFVSDVNAFYTKFRFWTMPLKFHKHLQNIVRGCKTFSFSSGFGFCKPLNIAFRSIWSTKCRLVYCDILAQNKEYKKPGEKVHDFLHVAYTWSSLGLYLPPSSWFLSIWN